VLINGAPVGDAQGQSFVVDAPPDVFTWQVVAYAGGDNGAFVVGPSWQAEQERVGLLRPAALPDTRALLYQRPIGAFFETPTGVLLLAIVLIGAGLGVVVGAAYLLSVRAQRRLF
jgi:hypothetical protein